MAKFDLAFHNPLNRHTLLDLDPRKLYKELYERLLCRPLPDLSNQHVSTGHLLSGYDAGLYAYVWYVTTIAALLTSLLKQMPVRSFLAPIYFTHPSLGTPAHEPRGTDLDEFFYYLGAVETNCRC